MGSFNDFLNKVMPKYSKYFKSGGMILFDNNDGKVSIMGGLVLKESVRENVQKKLHEYRKQHKNEEAVKSYSNLCSSQRKGAYRFGWGFTFDSSGEGYDDRGNFIVLFGAESNVLGQCERIEISDVQVTKRELCNMTADDKFDIAEKYGAIDKFVEKLDGVYDDVEKLMSV